MSKASETGEAIGASGVIRRSEASGMCKKECHAKRTVAWGW